MGFVSISGYGYFCFAVQSFFFLNLTLYGRKSRVWEALLLIPIHFVFSPSNRRLCVFHRFFTINFAINLFLMVLFHLPPFLLLYILFSPSCSNQNPRNSIDGDETAWEVYCLLRLRRKSPLPQRSLARSPRSSVAVSAHPFLGGLEPAKEDAYWHGDATHRRTGYCN